MLTTNDWEKSNQIKDSSLFLSEVEKERIKIFNTHVDDNIHGRRKNIYS